MEQIYERDPKQPPAPENVCKCACHKNKLGKPYAHDTKCCEEMNGTVDAPAPEKKWEEDFEFQFPELLGLTKNRDHKDASEEVIAFIRQILEEKAVEVEQRACVLAQTNDPSKAEESIRTLIFGSNPPSNLSSHHYALGKITAFLEAAAILRR